MRTLLVFNDENVLGEALDNAPTMNDHFSMDAPPMLSARAFGIHKAAADNFPDRFEILQLTFREVFENPAYKDAVIKAKGFWEYINYGDAEACKTYSDNIFEIGTQFKSLLTGKS